MQTYDVLMLLVLVCATIFGFWKGMAWQIASLASLAVSYIAALQFSERLAPTFGDTAPWNRFVAMLVIYVVTSFIIWTAFRLISGIIDKVRLEAFDKQLGAMFGFFKGVLLCVAVTFFAVTLLPPTQGELIVGSQSGQYIVQFLQKADAVMPPELHEVVDPYLHRVQQRLSPNYQANFPEGGAAAPAEAAQGSGWSWPSWPKAAEQVLPNIQWPQSTPSPNTTSQQPQWPTQPATGNTTQREPKAFEDPFSAQRPAGERY
jgi:membrane protein required for colicin V production